MSAFKAGLVLSSCVLFLISCSKPGARIENLPLPHPAKLAERLEKNRAGLRDFSGKGILRLRSPEGKSAFGVRLLYLRPNRLSITLFGAMGIEAGRITLSGDHYQITSLSEGLNASGNVDDFSWPEFFEIDITGIQFLDLCEPLARPPDHRDSIRVDRDAANQLYRVAWSDSSYLHCLWVDPYLPVALRELLLTSLGDTVWYREYKDVKNRAGIYVPFSWNLKVGQNDSSYEIQIEFSSLEVNHNLSPGDFKISYLSKLDTVEVPIECSEILCG